MSGDPAAELGKRERQIMEIVYRRGSATALDVMADLVDPPTNSSVRGMLRYLERKGYLTHERVAQTYVYRPTTPAHQVRASALTHIINIFFAGSISSAVAALLSSERLSDAEHERLSRMLADARKEADQSR